MPIRIAQLGIPLQKSGCQCLSKFFCISGADYYTPVESFVLPANRIYPLSTLPARHEEWPYEAICINLPRFPESLKDTLSNDYTEMLSFALTFANEKHIPYYFWMPDEASPMALTAKIMQQQQSMNGMWEYVMSYEIIKNSFFWRLTSPFRKFFDWTKKVVLHVPPLYKLGKGIRYCKRYGIRATAQKIKQKLREKKHLVYRELYTPQQLEEQKNVTFPREVKFSILVPLYNTPIRFLHEMIDSVTAQTYGDWELCLADGSDDKHAEVGEEVKKLAAEDKRILYRKLERNLGISENTNACLEMASGNYIALFDHDDILHPAALYNMMEAICEKDADFIYTDELTFLSPNIKKIITIHHKPDFAIDNLRANNYICHFSAFSREVLEAAGPFRAKYDGSQDHDMILRLTANAKHIVHIPKLLYFWRSHPMSVSQDINSKTYAINAGKNAVHDNIAATTGYETQVESSRAFPTIYRIKYNIVKKDLVSIIIPNKDHLEDLKKCIGSIVMLSTYPNYEVVIVDNGSTDPKLFEYYNELQQDPRFKITSLDIPFNYSKLNNHAATLASGKYFILLNNDIEIITPEWIEEMLMYVQREDVGAAGAMLYYPDNTIQHAGVIIGMGTDRIAGHAFHRQSRHAIGYMGRLCYANNLSAVTAACMMVKAELYRELGGLDEDFQVAYNDVDLCMKIRKAGYLIVWTPYAEAYHYESKTRGYEDNPEKQKRFQAEVARFREKWAAELASGDPYFNPNFSLDSGDFLSKD